MGINLEASGRRVYLVGDTYPVKDRIRDLGGHWDADRRAWWVSSSKREAAEKIADRRKAEVEAREASLPPASGRMVPVAGNTYPIRQQLRDMGGKWSGTVWLVPESRLEAAKALVPAPKPKAKRNSGPRKPRFPTEAPVPGAIAVQGRRDGRGDARWDVGGVVHLPKVSVPGGGPDGHYYVVLAAELRRPCEDAGWYDWTEHAWVRAATDEEAAPLAEAVAKREIREALARDLGAARGERVSVKMPEDAKVVVPRKVESLAASGERVAVVDGAVLHERVGDPDMIDSWYHFVVRITDAALVERVREYVASR